MIFSLRKLLQKGFVFLTLKKSERETFFICYLLFFLYVLPIILANIYYIDDLNHVGTGQTAWYGDGRPFSNVLMGILGFDKPFLDIAPLPLLVSGAILTYSLTLWAKKYLKNTTPVMAAVAIFFFYLNPFLLQNLSYRYEVLMMLVSASLVIFVFALPAFTKPEKRIPLEVLLLVGTLSSYQANLGLFIVMAGIEVLYYSLHKWNALSNLKNLIFHFAAAVLAIVFYKLIIVSKFVGQTKYGSMHSQLLVPSSFSDITIILQHVYRYAYVFMDYFKSVPRFYFIILLACLLVSMFLLFRNRARETMLDKTLGIIIILAALVMILTGPVLPFLLLRNPVYSPRVLISFSAVTLLLGVMIAFYRNKKGILAILFIPFIMFGYYYSYSYGNLLRAEEIRTNYIAQHIAMDLELLDPDRKITNIYYIGNSPTTWGYNVAVRKLPLMKKLVHRYFINDFFGAEKISQFLPERYIKYTVKNKFPNSYFENFIPLKSNGIYDLYFFENYMIIKFREK